MTDVAAIARERAINCEVRKVAYRQSKDGVVVSFLVHPSDVPDDLATAPLGTRYVLAMVALNDQDEPKEVMPTASGRTSTTSSQRTVEKVPALEDSTTPARARTPWDDMPAPQQAGILCDDFAFRRFLNEKFPKYDDLDAKGIVYAFCGITSRTQLKPGSAALIGWRDLVSKYRAWQREPEVIG